MLLSCSFQHESFLLYLFAASDKNPKKIIFVALKNNLFKKFVKKMSIASFTKYTIVEIEHIFPFLRIT